MVFQRVERDAALLMSIFGKSLSIIVRVVARPGRPFPLKLVHRE